MLFIVGRQQIYLTLHSLQLNFMTFGCQYLVFQFTLCLQQLCIGCCMILLLLFVPLNPHFSRLFFTSNDLIERSNLFGCLFLAELKLSFYSLLLDIKGFLSPFKVDNALVKFFNLSGFLSKRIFLDLDNFLKTLAFFYFFTKFDLSFMPNFVC